MVPDYITAHLLDYTPSRLLRSSEDKQLVVIKTLSHYGDISFQVAADKLWNAAPFQLKSIQNIDSFKSKLKTYFFMLNLIIIIIIYIYIAQYPANTACSTRL